MDSGRNYLVAGTGRFAVRSRAIFAGLPAETGSTFVSITCRTFSINRTKRRAASPRYNHPFSPCYPTGQRFLLAEGAVASFCAGAGPPPRLGSNNRLKWDGIPPNEIQKTKRNHREAAMNRYGARVIRVAAVNCAASNTATAMP